MTRRLVPARRRISTALAAGALLLAAAPAILPAQSIADVLGAMRRGGGWIQIPVVAGRGELTTAAIPAVGLRLRGCMEIYFLHSGRWEIDIRDTYGNGGLQADVRPGEDIPFTYEPGAMAQLDISVRWSEPRDTSLTVWVGLGSADGERDPCEPVYGDSGGLGMAEARGPHIMGGRSDSSSAARRARRMSQSPSAVTPKATNAGDAHPVPSPSSVASISQR